MILRLLPGVRLHPIVASLGLHRGCFRSLSTVNRHTACEIEGEELRRYRVGGYHPIHIGDRLDDGRFTVLQKLGWGGYGTTWLVSDARLGFNVALKVSVSGTSQHSNEIGILQRLSLGNRNGETHHIVQLLHSFSLEGPNGKHDCIATELLGPSISSARERYRDARLPGHLAWQAVRPTIQALAYMHEKGIVHGDLHPGNILLPCDDHFRQPDSEALKSLGSPEREAIHVTPYTPSLPRYMVRSISLPLVPRTAKACSFKVIDFGSSFVSGLGTAPQMRCPLPFRAPEALLTGHFDSSADIWSLGCTIFSLVVGYPPFESMFSDEKSLVAEWVASLGSLPQEWDGIVMEFKEITPAELDTADLIGWFRETYYDEGKEPFFAKEDLEKIGDLILLMLKYRPEDRPTASDLLEHPLIQQLSFPPRGEDEMLGVGQRQIVLQKPNEQDSDQASPLRGRHMYLP